MEKALTAFVKKGDPKATATITGTTPTDNYIAVDFQFTNFSGTTEDGEKVIAASGTGLADFWLRDGKWQFDKVVIDKKPFKVGETLK
jgi:hypothetical protein